MSIKEWIKQQPIQQKLIYSNLLGIAVAFIPIIIVMVVYEYFTLRHAIIKELRVQADIVAESASAALAFRDHQSAGETLFALHGAHDLMEAHLFLPDGTVFESYYKKARTAAFTYSKDLPGEQVNIATVIINKPVLLRSEVVGSLVMVSSLETFYNRLVLFSFFIITIGVIGFLLARWIAMHISVMITDPLRALTNVTQRIMQEQDYSMPLSVNAQDEVGKLSDAFGEMMSQIRTRDLSLQQLAYYDRVTAIPNRHYFEERIAQAVGNAERYGTHCYLLMIDLDDFKIVNDTLGHHIGDELLRHVSRNLSQTMRQSDSFFRIGGDEFAVILESSSSHEAVGKIAQKIISVISASVVLEGHEVKVGASIGISCYPKYSNDVRSLMSSADIAMYSVKSQGKGGYRIYDLSLRSI